MAYGISEYESGSGAAQKAQAIVQGKKPHEIPDKCYYQFSNSREQGCMKTQNLEIDNETLEQLGGKNLMINTLFIIIEQTMLHLPLMFGAYLSFSLLKVPDLSIESAYVVGAILGSSALINIVNIPMSMMIFIILIASFLGGALVGMTSSLLTQKARFPHLLSSIVTFGLFHGINQFISATYVSLSKIGNPLRLL